MRHFPEIPWWLPHAMVVAFIVGGGILCLVS